MKWFICLVQGYWSTLLSIWPLLRESSFYFLPARDHCVKMDWWNLAAILLFSELNRGDHSGQAQSMCQRLCPPDSLTVCAMMSCCRGGAFRSEVWVVCGLLVVNPWPSGRGLPAWSNQLGETSLRLRGQTAHVATSPLLANDPGFRPWGQKVRGRP